MIGAIYNFTLSCGYYFYGWPNQTIRIGNLKVLPDSKRAVWRYL